MQFSPIKKALLIFAAALIIVPNCFGEEPRHGEDLLDLGLEQLMEVNITSVSKRDEKLGKVAAAVYVLTSEDLRRSGVTSIPEALRLVPGLNVARLNSNSWAISSRGFNGEFSNKLLVLIDGRSIYTPLFSGVFWDLQDMPIAEIERIEVIRGPGATIWGANAVNGIINIISKSSDKVHGFSVAQTVGNVDRDITTVNYGDRISDDLSYRVYVNYFDHGDQRGVNGIEARDSWNKLQGGFRSDWNHRVGEKFSLQGDVYSGKVNNWDRYISQPEPPYYARSRDYQEISGGNIVAKWEQELSSAAKYRVQAYFENQSIDALLYRDTLNTADLEAQLDVWTGAYNHLIAGLEYRNADDSALGRSFGLRLSPEHRNDALYSAFIQDEIPLLKDTLAITLGSKFEHNDYTGFEMQPSARLSYMPTSWQTFWGAISKAVRTPARVEHEVQYASQPVQLPESSVPGIAFANGNPEMDSESLLAYEVGYRAEAGKRFSLDTTAFLNRYHRLRTLEPSAPVMDPRLPYIAFPSYFENRAYGSTWGVELAASVTPFDFLRWRTNYTYLHMNIRTDAGSGDPSIADLDGLKPSNQVQSWLSADLGSGFESDLIMYYVDSLPACKTAAYTRFDLRLGHNFTEKLSVGVVVQNLFDAAHKEFSEQGSFAEPNEIRRAYYGTISLKF